MVEQNISCFTKKETRAWAGRTFPKVLTPLFSTGYVMLHLCFFGSGVSASETQKRGKILLVGLQLKQFGAVLKRLESRIQVTWTKTGSAKQYTGCYRGSLNYNARLDDLLFINKRWRIQPMKKCRTFFFFNLLSKSALNTQYASIFFAARIWSLHCE